MNSFEELVAQIEAMNFSEVVLSVREEGSDKIQSVGHGDRSFYCSVAQHYLGLALGENK